MSTCRSCLMFAMLACAACSAVAEVHAPLAPDGRGTARGLAVIDCVSRDAHVQRRSRGAILEHERATTDGDLILTAAHGLPETVEAIRSDCTVDGQRGRAARIAAVWLGRGAHYGDGDWALLRTAAPMRGDVTRLPVLHLGPAQLNRLVETRAPVLLLRGTGSELERCALEARAWLDVVRVGPAVFAHSCPSWIGLSGSPLLVGFDGGVAVFGLHLGRLLRPPLIDGPTFVRIGRIIDEPVIQALSEAAGSAPRRRTAAAHR